jgi:HlyD family secretion protein
MISDQLEMSKLNDERSGKMTVLRIPYGWKLTIALTFCFFSLMLSGCTENNSDQYQGYAEGEFVFVAAPDSGRLEKRWVERGQEVESGAPLFTLEQESELAERREAEARVQNARARLANLTTSRRASEIDAIRAELARAESELDYSTLQLHRHEDLFSEGLVSKSQLDKTRTDHQAALELVAETEARLKTASESIGRDKEIAAARAEVEASVSALAQSDWKLSQRAIHAPAKAFVQDTFYSEGEWVQGGNPVVSLLPPANIKVRFFVPEALAGSLKVGQKVRAVCDGCGAAVSAKISYISSQPEFTPPVIYSREQRTKLVFMVEAVPDPSGAALLHPGQPVDVELVK